jgi:amino acid adenylation domain-containing protein
MTGRLQDWLVRQAEHRPEAVALVFRGQATTYGVLDQAANRTARALQAMGCEAGDRVGLLLPKSPVAVTAMMGALKAGCVYVPIDTACPPARIDRILRVCDCRCLLVEDSTAHLLRECEAATVPHGPRIVRMEPGRPSPSGPDSFSWSGAFSWADVETFSGAPLDSPNRSWDAAHILFTSGSTGIPKGVVITHANVLHFVNWAVRTFGMGPDDRMSGHAPLHFDLATFDLYGALASGGQLHLVPPEINLLPHRLVDFIRSAQLTQWFSVPSALTPVAAHDALPHGDLPLLKRLLWCGEKFPTSALIYWMQRLPRVMFVNLYGPTEATIASSFYRVDHCPESPRDEIPIGEPCDGERLLVLDEQLRPVPPQQTGDLYIGGVGLSPGYWRDPQKTTEAFLADPAGPHGGRIYKTGDLARVGGDGMIYLVGRSDSQIKCRGYRIELGEIENALHAVPGIEEAAAVALDSPSGGVEIACAYVAQPGCELTASSVRKQIARSLPPYMLPSRWLILEKLPRNGNGKLDRGALKLRFQRAAVDPLTEETPFEAAGASRNAGAL